jgi:hypothetical protein
MLRNDEELVSMSFNSLTTNVVNECEAIGNWDQEIKLNQIVARLDYRVQVNRGDKIWLQIQ